MERVAGYGGPGTRRDQPGAKQPKVRPSLAHREGGRIAVPISQYHYGQSGLVAGAHRRPVGYPSMRTVGTSFGIIRRQPVAALTSSTETPGAISRSASPSFVTSKSPRLVATRLTTPRAVAGIAQRSTRRGLPS